MGARIIISSSLIFILAGYTSYDILNFYVTRTRSVKILVLSALLQIALIMLVRILMAVTNYGTIEFNVTSSEGLTFIYALFPVCIIELGFICMLLISDSISNKERRTAGKLALAILERDRLYAMVAHELSSPLNSCLHMIEMLELSDRETDPSHCFTTIRLSLIDLRMILMDLLDWARRCRSDREKRTGFLTGIQIRQILSHFIKPLKAKNMAMDLSLLEKTQGRVDKDLVFISLRMLMHNAFRHGKPGTCIQMALHEKTDQCSITITNQKHDSGDHKTGQEMGLHLLQSQIGQDRGDLSIAENQNHFTAILTLPFIRD